MTFHYLLFNVLTSKMTSRVKPGFHSNAIACVVCVACVA